MHETTHRDIPEQARAVPLTMLRLGVGVVMMAHGWSKLTDIDAAQQSFATMGIPLPEVSVYLAVAGELLGGLGLFLGMLTPVAALGVLVTMLVAIFAVHLPNGLMMKNSGFEYPMVLALVAFYFMVRGPGPFSVDAWLHSHRDVPRWVPLGRAESQLSA